MILTLATESAARCEHFRRLFRLLLPQKKQKVARVGLAGTWFSGCTVKWKSLDVAMRQTEVPGMTCSSEFLWSYV